MELVGRYGTADVSIEEIAREAGVSKGLLYHYFPTKNDFFLAVLARSQTELDEQFSRERELSAVEQFDQNLDGFLRFVDDHAAGYVAVANARGREPRVQKMVEQRRRRRVDELVALAAVLAGVPRDRGQDAAARGRDRGLAGLLGRGDPALAERPRAHPRRGPRPAARRAAPGARELPSGRGGAVRLTQLGRPVPRMRGSSQATITSSETTSTCLPSTVTWSVRWFSDGVVPAISLAYSGRREEGAEQENEQNAVRDRGSVAAQSTEGERPRARGDGGVQPRELNQWWVTLTSVKASWCPLMTRSPISPTPRT